MAAAAVVLALIAVLLVPVTPAAPPWRVADDAACQGWWTCLRRDLSSDLADILQANQYNVTSSLSVERQDRDDLGTDVDGDLDRMATSLNEAGLPTLAATAIKLFETHALVWKLWPGLLHLKIFRHLGEGMDAAVEIPPNTDGRTWGAIGARRRITMALLPIMYKMGVGTTLLGVLTFIALKTMFMVSILFVLAVSSFFKHKLGSLGGHGGITYIPVGPPPGQHKEVHVHVHADPHKQAYGGWHRYSSHGHGHHGPAVEHHPVYPPYHSGPGVSEDSYYETEPPAYYRRAGVAVGNLGGTLGGTLGPHAHMMSRWDPIGSGSSTGEPAYYTGSYS